MNRFWEIVFCVPLLFCRHVCLSNLKQVPSRKLPLNARKTVFSHLKCIACARASSGGGKRESQTVQVFFSSVPSFFLLPRLPSPSAPFTHKIQQQSSGSWTNFCFLLHSSRDRLWSRNVQADWCSFYDVTCFCREEGEMSSVRCSWNIQND